MCATDCLSIKNYKQNLFIFYPILFHKIITTTSCNIYAMQKYLDGSVAIKSRSPRKFTKTLQVFPRTVSARSTEDSYLILFCMKMKSYIVIK